MVNPTVSIRDINRRKLLNVIRRHPGISRARLVDQTGLSKATVTTLINELIEEGILFEDGLVDEQEKQAGRPPIRLKLNGEFRYAIGIELTGDECIAILVDICCNPVKILRSSTDLKDFNSVVETITQMVHLLMVNYPWERLLGVQVGVPAIVDAQGKVVVQAENFGWFSVPLAQLIQEKLKKSVSLTGRQAAGAVGEYWYGVGRGHSNLIYITHNIGIGSGIIFHNQLYTGNNNSAGEFGHITVVPNGRVCACGNTGCLETVAGGPAILRKILELIPEHQESSLYPYRTSPDKLKVETVLAAAIAEDPLAAEVINEAVHYLAIGITTLVNLFNPSLVILGGLLAHDSNFFLERIRHQVRTRGFPVSTQNLQIVPSVLGDKAVAIGAASLMIDTLFT